MQRRVEGPDIAGRRVLVVEDVSTTGSSPLTAVRGVARGRGRRGRRGVDRRPRRSGGRSGPPDWSAGRPTHSPTSAWLCTELTATRRRPGRRRRAAPATLAGRSAARPGAARARRSAQRRRRYRYWRVDGDRRRPRHPPARLRGRHRELAARPEHRHGRPDRQRVPGPRGDHRRTSPVEPARRHGDRSLPAHPTRRLRGRAGRRGRLHDRRDRQPARRGPARDGRAAPPSALLLFGQEGSGLTAEARAAAELVCSIAQFGSTRSINAGVAAGIAMHTWIRQHALYT